MIIRITAKIMKKLIDIIIILVATLMLLTSCAGSADITGYYTCEGLQNVYYFSPAGKIYVNDSYESYSLYEVSGNKIITYIEGAEDQKMEFDFKKTEDGFMMGKLSYRKLSDYSDFNSSVEGGNPQ